MELGLVQESWQELRRYINTMDRSDAAEGLIAVLVENGINATDIQDAFHGDDDIRAALSVYLDEQDLDVESESDDIDDDDY